MGPRRSPDPKPRWELAGGLEVTVIKLDNLHPGDSPLETGGPWVAEASRGKAQMPVASVCFWRRVKNLNRAVSPKIIMDRLMRQREHKCL